MASDGAGDHIDTVDACMRTGLQVLARTQAEAGEKAQQAQERAIMAIKTRLGAVRYNNRVDRLMADCRRIERERLARGEMPNPSLTSPEEARKYGWEIVGRTVTRLVSEQA